MRKERKVLSLILAMMLLVSGLMGCGSDVAQTSKPAKEMKTATAVKAKTLKDKKTVEEKETSKPEETDTEKAEKEETEAPKALPGMEVHFVDVGQGLGTLVKADGQVLVYDGGSRHASRKFVAYLKEQGVETIDYLVSSHYDEDHLGGLIGCLHAFNVKNVICSDYVHTSKLYQTFIDLTDEKGLKRQHMAPGETFDFGKGRVTVLGPVEIRKNASNDNSVVIRIDYGERSFLFTGDAEHKSEEAMVQKGENLKCDVLVPGHHGSATASCWDFLRATLPEYAVISCGEKNSYGHPHVDTMEKLEAMEIEVFRTDSQGDVVCKTDGIDLNWSAKPCNDYSGRDGGTKVSEPEPQKKTVQEETTETENVQKVAEENSVWISRTGSKYHRINNCGRMNPNTSREIPESEAVADGMEKCKKCW